MAATPALANPLPPPLPPLHGAGPLVYGAPVGGSWYSGHGPAPSWNDVDADRWIDHCAASYRDARRDSNIEGAVIGGVIGGLAGNQIAGDGDRLLGTVIGGAAGAVAGAAIDSVEGDPRSGDEAYRWCEQRWASYHGGNAVGVPGYAYGYAQAFTWVPIVYEVRTRASDCRCAETEEAWIEIEDEAVETVRIPVYDRAPAPAKGKRLRSSKPASSK